MWPAQFDSLLSSAARHSAVTAIANDGVASGSIEAQRFVEV